jgi:NAD-dependent deacetylase
MLNAAHITQKLSHKENLNVVVLTGAGISAESGISTFRDADGLWQSHSIEELATPEGFKANPDLVYHFYNQRRMQIMDKQTLPNPAHMALSKLEVALGTGFTLITQNVDNLHEKGGVKRVLHMHGSLLSEKCVVSDKSRQITHDLNAQSGCDCCEIPQHMRPDIVWFGEMPYYMNDIECSLNSADLFVSIGTSGNVYPAAGFVQLARHCGAYCVELNLEPSEGKSLFDEHHTGKASLLVPAFVERLLSLRQYNKHL